MVIGRNSGDTHQDRITLHLKSAKLKIFGVQYPFGVFGISQKHRLKLGQEPNEVSWKQE